ncbi:hypothetical protein [Streptomyces sp. NPDC051173]|uniref:hypothetical protein n=1 Tax=Streptomyces sp. NPDC051173 TaxID=3155164 RepID=UPI0034505801
MSSFTTHRRRVLDQALPARVRHTNLRCCLVQFAPYGFRATYDHLCHSAGIPRPLDKDPDSLVRAVEELHAARRLWLAHVHAFAAQRRREKSGGQRELRRDQMRPVRQRGWQDIAYCPDPSFRPEGELSAVVGRVLRSPGRAAAGSGLVCRVCGGRDGVAWDGSLWVHRLCATCGVSLAVVGPVRDVV